MSKKMHRARVRRIHAPYIPYSEREGENLIPEWKHGPDAYIDKAIRFFTPLKNKEARHILLFLLQLQQSIGEVRLSEINHDHLGIAMDKLMKRMSLATAHRHMTGFRGWMRRTFDIRYKSDRIPTRRYKGTIHVEKAISYEQYMHLIDNIIEGSGTWCWIVTLTETGLRRGEVANLKAADIDFQGGYIYIQEDHTKMGRRRRVPMTPRVKLAMEYAFLDVRTRRYCGAKYTFEDQTCKRTLPSMKVSKWAKQNGVRTSLHGLRHTYITYLLDQGIPIHEVKNLAGHSSILVTDLYASNLHRHDEVIKKLFQ